MIDIIDNQLNLNENDINRSNLLELFDYIQVKYFIYIFRAFKSVLSNYKIDQNRCINRIV